MNDYFIACLKEVKTKYVMTCDDDLIFPKTLEILQNVLIRKTIQWRKCRYLLGRKNQIKRKWASKKNFT